VKDHFNNWLTEKMKIAGVLACGVRGPDRKTFTRSASPQFSPVALEQACRCLSDTFQIINANHFPSGLVRWVYESHFVYGSVRQDGHCLAIVTRRSTSDVPDADLEGMIAEFHGLPA
jgi:hypothetical protein